MKKHIKFGLAIAIGVAFLLPVSTPAQDSDKLTLRQAVTLALQNSREIALARMQYTVALNAAGVDRADFRPNLYTGSGAAYTSGFPSTVSGQAPAIFSLSYTQSVFNLPLRGQLKAAETRAESQKIELERTRDAAIVRAATTYLELAEVRHSLQLLRNEGASAEKIAEVTRERSEAGQELPLENTRSQLTLARIRQRIIRLEDRDAILSLQLCNLTGTPEQQSLDLVSDETSFAVDQQETDMIAAALKSNPFVTEAEKERDARQHILKGAKGGFWPTVSVVGLYQVLGKYNNYDEFFSHFQRNNVTIGVDVHIPIFSSKTFAEVKLARSQLSEAELALGNRRQEVRADVIQKARDVRELDASHEVARLDLQLAQESLQIVQTKFDQGRATLRDIEQARLDESDKWVAFLDAEFARQQGQLTLLQATGQLAKVFQ
ncbi:MAG TPA: TolC family protein [Terriglobales bacterium]|nr:TolC family protein [Terriglobales bacterium]